jgi:hydroxylaminobenzene mutase
MAEAAAENSEHLQRQGQRLLQLGVLFFLFACFEGFAVPYLASPPLGLSVHRLCAFTAVFMLAFGLLWPRLELGRIAARAAFWLFIYSDIATVAGYVLAAVWGAGNTVIPLAAGTARGTAFQETAIMAVIYSAAPTGIAAFALILWGLRKMPVTSITSRGGL